MPVSRHVPVEEADQTVGTGRAGSLVLEYVVESSAPGLALEVYAVRLEMNVDSE